jgi:Xaa-Pro aminopeptidase
MHSERAERLQESLGRHRLDFLLVTHLPNIRYLTGFTGSAGVLVIDSHSRNVFITDGRYKEQARQQVRGAGVVIAKKALLVAAGEELGLRRKRRGMMSAVGIESGHLTVADRDRLAGSLPHHFRIKNAPPLVEQLRLVKDQSEIGLIRDAVIAGAALFEVVLESIRPGRKEIEVAAELEHAARKAGCDGMSFDTIIASGERSALPHGRASAYNIPRSGFVVCDFGVILAGYCSDMTRTVHVGRANRDARTFYEAVRAAQLAGMEAVRPGTPVADVDSVARSVLKKAGLGRFFTHSTGHGVGLEIHEAPRIAAGQIDVLQPGMIVTIEPGAYIPGKWGVRVEDMVVVTEGGHEVLTPTRKDLICI